MTPATAPDPVPATHPRLRQVGAAGSALAVALVPLVVGVLVAKGMAADPHAPVNALISGGGQRAGLPRAEWRRRGHDTVRRLRTVRRETARRCAHVRGLRRPAA
ncbi:hypothetical protein Slala03_19360 [Streptomyces lavendulae subsp. lavendulae]|uniref:hypothetical protein n=1 Tax=Streptomyces lavendulae TaxID=1914 RepID=UPI0024A10165|nr:hypothetical protein [Streptomyces lavendulae]GLV82247.1 hypothetical protein Slala03_19360 [Streptomyces lavendulae subsp. lavendulae]GLX36249.1 hypothetical protein Sros01_23220 [Streptomyces roseochromogenus]